MSFFKDFKDDLSQAAKELIPGEDTVLEELEEDSEMVVNTLESELDVESELSKLDGLLEKVTKDGIRPESGVNFVDSPEIVTQKEDVPQSEEEFLNEEEFLDEEVLLSEDLPQSEEAVNEMEPVPVEPVEDNLNQTIESLEEAEEDKVMNELNNELEEVNTMDKELEKTLTTDEISDEVAVITEGTKIKGNMESNGSLDIRGKIEGNVSCNGKLVVTGIINGNSTSSEFFADSAKIEGEVVSSGTVKIGLGSVIIGNITATSAVIAGAIKGDIDVQGPVVVDTSAVIMGNIKSRSVQINNGAVIEGFCSQCYAEIDVESLFGEKKVK